MLFSYLNYPVVYYNNIICIHCSNCEGGVRSGMKFPTIFITWMRGRYKIMPVVIFIKIKRGFKFLSTFLMNFICLNILNIFLSLL